MRKLHAVSRCSQCAHERENMLVCCCRCRYLMALGNPLIAVEIEGISLRFGCALCRQSARRTACCMMLRGRPHAGSLPFMTPAMRVAHRPQCSAPAACTQAVQAA